VKLLGIIASLILQAAPGLGQEPSRVPMPRQMALDLAPDAIGYVVHAADSILASGGERDVSLEAWSGEIATGVYLHGTLGGANESIGYGRDASSRRYLWLSVSRGDSLDYMAMAFDVDHDLAPDFLLFRTVDHAGRREFLTEYRTAVGRDEAFDISVQAACRPPRCDPATWTIHPRTRVDVTPFWFEMWRPVMGLAAMRGERWVGRPVASLPRAPTRGS
jgi:hypothetical protein